MVAPHFSAHISDSPELAERKKHLRTRCLQVLRTHPRELDSILCARLSDVLLAHPYSDIACVWPLPHETDIRPVCHTLHDANRCVLLPETPPRGQALIFRRWTPSCALLRGRFGTLVPDGPECTPQLILVPLVGFDRSGNRLGYGGGYYDRTLAALPEVPAIGYALSLQEVDQIPSGPYDKPLSCIITEKETLHFD